MNQTIAKADKNDAILRIGNDINKTEERLSDASLCANRRGCPLPVNPTTL